jgi:DUF2892 family protein
LIHRKAGQAGPWLSAALITSLTNEGSMTCNIGIVERTVRVAVGLLLIAYAIPVWFAPSGWNLIGWIGIIPLVTGLAGMCPLYSLLGISTCPPRPTAR